MSDWPLTQTADGVVTFLIFADPRGEKLHLVVFYFITRFLP